MAIPFWDNVGTEDLLVQTGTNAAFTGPAAQKTYADNPWDVVILGGEPVPGICTITADPKRKVDKQKGAGAHGGQPIFHGYDPADLSMTVTMWTPDQLQQWGILMREIIWPAIEKKDGLTKAQLNNKKNTEDKKIVLQIYHPALDMLGIRSVAVVQPGSLRKGPQPQTMVQTLKLIEYYKLVHKNAIKVPVAPAPLIGERSSASEEQGSHYNNEARDPSVTKGKATFANGQKIFPGKDSFFTGP